MAIYEDTKVLNNVNSVLYISGQTPEANGHTPIAIEDQLDVVIQKLTQLLAEQGLSAKHLVKVTIYITNREYLPAVRKKLGAYFDKEKPAATLAVVSGFIDEAFKVEIDAIAGF